MFWTLQKAEISKVSERGCYFHPESGLSFLFGSLQGLSSMSLVPTPGTLQLTAVRVGLETVAQFWLLLCRF
jgi:hypothetical protein